MAQPLTALVTGANRGIGQEVARQLAAQGYHVVLGSRQRSSGEQAASAIPGSTSVVELDVSSSASISSAVQQIQAEHGRIDVLVNNAAVLLDDGQSLLNTSIQIFQQTYAINVWGPLELAQRCIPLMTKQRYGRIVNVSSGMGQVGALRASTAAYRLSKAGLNALTLMLADAVRDRPNILVNAVCPGWVRTAMGGPHADRSVSEGAETIVWLATLPQGGPSGQFFRDRQQIAW